MSFPQPGWPPPPPYAGAAGRPWVPYGVPPPHSYAAYPARPQVPPKDEYWATELMTNPLGLENMHIRSDSVQKVSNNTSSSSSTARVPPTSYSRASDYAIRNSYPPNTSTKASLAPSNSHPNTRVPSPVRPRRYEREREPDRPVAAPDARYAAYSGTAVVSGDNGTSQVPPTHTHSPSRAYGGRTSVPVEAGNRYSSASASAAAHAAQMASRSQTIPGAASGRLTNAPTSAADVYQAQGMQRSKTMPGEMPAASSRQRRTVAEPMPRRSSDRYDHRHPQDDYEESEESDEGSGWRHANADGISDKEVRNEKRGMDRVRAWASNIRNLRSSQHDLNGDHDRERERGTGTKEKSRSEYHNHARPTRNNHDNYGDERAYGVHGASAAHYGRVRERVPMTRHASAPDANFSSVARASQDQNPSFVTSRITEEPEGMHEYSQSLQQPRSRSQTQYGPPFRSPHKAREREWTYREDHDPSGSSSGSTSDVESEDGHKSPGLRRKNSTRGRERMFKGTPHPAPPRRLTTVRSDALRVDEGTGMVASAQGKVHLPSPRSLRQSSRTPSSRPSYEQVHAEREQEYQRSKSPNGHLMAGTSSVSAAAAAASAGGFGYGTPPVTPTRQDQLHRTEGTRTPYAPQPTTSATAISGSTEPAPTYQTPTRLTYLYRENNASPSPISQRTGSTKPQTHQHSMSQGGQYGVSSYAPATDPNPRKRSPRASRSPSPLPTGQGTSSSSAYYASLGGRASSPSRAQSRSRAHSHAQSHDHSYTRYATAQAAVAPAAAEYDAHRRSNSRAAALAGSGYSSASGAAASHVPTRQVTSEDTRHVRAGYWNRRGDHLTDTGYVVYCPPGRCYPRDLADYPDNIFKDHLGHVVRSTPDTYPELPDSVPKSAGRAPERSYDSFIKYVLVSSKT